MRKLIAVSTIVLIGATSCATQQQIKAPDLTRPPEFSVGKVDLPKNPLEKLKKVKVNAEFHSVPLSVTLRTICRSTGIACDLTGFNSSLPITVIGFKGNLYDLLQTISFKTGYVFRYDNGVLTVVSTDVSREKEKEYYQKKLKVNAPKVSLELRGVPLFSVLNLISEQTGYTVVPDRLVDLQKKVFVAVKNAPLDRALEVILSPLGYSFRIDGEHRKVYVSALETRVFKIPYFPQTVKFTYTAGETGTGGGSSEGGSSTSSSSSGTASKEVTIETDFWKELKDNLKNIVSKDGRYLINKTARVVVVTDYPDNVRRVSEAIRDLIKSVSQQVQFRVAIYELNYSKQYSTGVDWSAVFGSQSLKVQQIGDQSIYYLNWSGYFKMGKSNPFNYLVSLLQKYGKVRTVYDNYVRTLSGDTVAVVPAETYRYLEKIEVQSQADTGLVTHTPIFGELALGTQVYITPIKLSDSETEFQINITNRYLKSVAQYTFDGTTYTEPERIGKTQISLTTVIPKGQLEVITGIKQYRSEGTRVGIPEAMDVPVAGELFQKRDKNVRLTEYVIAIQSF